jgi:hypothetical protein
MTQPTQTTYSQSTTPGYWNDANGNLVPESKVKPIDQVRNQLVYDLCRNAEVESLALSAFKLSAMAEVAAFVAISMEQYGVKTGGDKGNVTLVSYDGRYKLVRQMQDKITFGEQLMAAKSLIDECVHEWAVNANDNIKALVNHAFQTDKEGKINTGRVLSLRRLDIKDEKWQAAMQAIADSMQTASTKPYIRFYKRNETTQEYVAINLDVAAV